MAKRSPRSRRNQQILFVVLSVIVVVSMGLALITAPTVTPVQPKATSVPIYITPLAASPTPSVMPAPTRIPTP